MKTNKNKLHFCRNMPLSMVKNATKSGKVNTNLTSIRIPPKKIFLDTMEKPIEYPYLRINRDEEDEVDLKIKKNKVNRDESQETKDYILYLQTKGWVSLIGKDLRKKRIEKRISQTDLAFMLKWDQNYVSRIEAGKINISLENLTKIAGALGCYVKIEDKQYVL